SEAPEFHGEVFDFAGFHFAPRPHAGRRLPSLIGGASAAAMKRAARLGDGWVGDGLTFEELELSLPQLASAVKAAGRQWHEVAIAMRTGPGVVAGRGARH